MDDAGGSARIACADRVGTQTAIQWVAWASHRCNVPITCARPMQPPARPWCRTVFVSMPPTAGPYRTWMRNALPRSQAREAHLKRCQVAHCMATVPHPELNMTASLCVIDFAMRWGSKQRAQRAVSTWETELERRQPK